MSGSGFKTRSGELLACRFSVNLPQADPGAPGWLRIDGFETSSSQASLLGSPRLQTQGIKIGSTTDFLRSMVDVLEGDAKKQGYTPDRTASAAE